MGYASTQKRYILYDIHAKSFLVSRHMVFQEHIFPFKTMQTAPNPLLPILELSQLSSYPFLSQLPYESSSVPTTNPPVTSPTSALISNNTTTSSVPPLEPNSLEPHVSIPPRRSSRHSKPPLYLQDYVTKPSTSTCTYPLNNHITYAYLSSPNQRTLQDTRQEKDEVQNERLRGAKILSGH